MRTALPVTDRQLRDAIEGADMPPRDYRIFGALLFRADWTTGVIPERFQDRSLEALAVRCRMSRTAMADGLNHLERHGWVKRERQPPGRARSTHYALAVGADCDCRPAPKVKGRTNAQRARDYRERRKASGILVTDPESSHGILVTKRPGERDEVAGQTPVSDVSAVRGESRWGVMEAWPDDTIGSEINAARDGRISR